MKTITNSVVALFAAALMTGCLQETESELDKIIQRDKALLEEYMASNGVTATQTQLGYYYHKDTEVAEGTQITNNDVVGIYYEMRTLEGFLIESYLDETKEPVIFKYSDNGLWPAGIGYAAGLAKVGEEMTLYIPSYLAYNTYSYQQLISSGDNLVVKIKYAQKYTESQLKEREDNLIQAYIEENELEGYERNDSGIYIRVVEEGEGEPSKNGNTVTFTYKLYQMGNSDALIESSSTNPFISLGSSTNVKFLNEALVNQPEGTVVEALAPSHTAYGETIQIIPSVIRKDLVEKGELTQITSPYEPIEFKAEIIDIK